MSEEIDFIPMMEGVARLIWGDPNPKLSKPNLIKWGDSGSRTVEVEKGTWIDSRVKKGGGVLGLLKHEYGLEGADAFTWLKDRGFQIPERGQEQHQRNQGKGGGLGELVASFPYHDEQGKALYEVCRFEDGTLNDKGKRNKTFRQRRHDPKHPDAKGGGYVWHIRDVRRVLYRLPEVLAAIAAGRPIVLVEGEKAVKAAVGIGLDATTNAMGALKWEASFSESLRGADVIIIPDNDPSGWNHAQLQASSLHGIAKRVRLLHIPVKDPSDDIYEWVQRGGTKEDFFKLADALSTWMPQLPVSRFNAVQWSRLDEPGQEYEYRVKGVLAKYGVCVVGGPSGSGKSFLCSDMGFSIARGIEYAGRKTQPGLVLYQAGEGGVGLKKRMRAYRKHHEVAGDVPFVLLPGELDLHSSDEHTNAFIAECRAWQVYYAMPIGAIFVDTFSTATPGANENDGGDVSKILARCSRIAAECNTVVVLVHHMNAEGSKLRGHSSIRANVDNVLLVTKMEIKDASGRWQRKVELVKNKDGEDGVSWNFVLKQIEVGTDNDGEPITSCVVEEPAKGGAEQQAQDKLRLTNNDDLIYRCLKTVVDRDGIDVPSGVRVPSQVQKVAPWDVFCHEVRRKWAHQDDPAVTAEENEKRRNDAVRKAIQRCTDKLMRLGVMDRDMDSKVAWDLGLPRWAKTIEKVADPEEPQKMQAAQEMAENDLGF